MTVAATSTRVLLIEDESAYTVLVEKKLAAATPPFEVEAALSLAAGIEKVRQTAFDAVVLDLNLPDSRGSDTVGRLREAAPELPIVVLSALDDDTTIYDTLHCGAQEYLNKDAALNLLPRTIVHAIERNRVDLALKQSTDRWFALFEHNPVETIVVDREGCVTDLNAAKRTSGDRLPAVGDRMYVDYAARHERDMRGELMQCIETGKTRNFPEQKYQDKVLSINIAPFPKDNSEGAIIASQDVTERKRGEEEIERLARFSSENPNPILRASADGSVLYANEAAEPLLKSWRSAVGKRLPRKWRDRVERALDSKESQHTRAKCKGRTISLTLAPVADEGYINIYGLDITEQLALETQLRQSQKLESVGTLASGVAHEINNPINGIMNYAQLILDELGPDSPASEFAAEIGKETRRVATIVRNLLDFSRPRKQGHSPARTCDIVETALSLIRSVLQRDQIALEVDVPEDLPKLKCRSQQIQQVLMNLLTNARDALNEKYRGYDDDKIVLISTRAIADLGSRISESEDKKAEGAAIHNPQSAVRITVEDHGPGIPKRVREHLFDPFYTSKRPDKGTGLGLSISYTIAKEHGGELSVESKVGKWTRFHVDLPIAD